jgi:hypothetical protein
MRLTEILYCVYAGTLLGIAALPATAAECTASSGSNRVALIELYTSEGCSSCPPADRWLSRIASLGFGPGRVVPLAMHVDYWDRLGWPDRFAQSLFSERQRAMAALNGAGFVYTPQVLVNGKDFRGWSGGAFSSRIDQLNRLPARARVQASVSAPAADQIAVKVAATAPREDSPALYVALYENGLSSEVRAGENAGSTLRHDYVVREWRGPIPIDGKTDIAWQGAFTLKPGWNASQMGVAAFVQNAQNGEVLQAIQLALCKG